MDVMTKPYPKHQAFGDDLTAAERLHPARVAVLRAIILLQQFCDITENASERLTEEQLQTICDAASAAYGAASNARFLGESDYNPFPVSTIKWNRRDK